MGRADKPAADEAILTPLGRAPTAGAALRQVSALWGARPTGRAASAMTAARRPTPEGRRWDPALRGYPSTTTEPAMRAIISGSTEPVRTTRGSSAVQTTTVDATRLWVTPSSSTRSACPRMRSSSAA
jgi:hypothetical protein